MPGPGMEPEASNDERALRTLTGWGGQPATTSRVVTPATPGELSPIGDGRTGYIPRGLGRSYGDAAQLAGGTVIDMTGFSGVELDPREGLATVQAGTSIGRLIAVAAPLGWFPQVVPGTRHVTIGGAIAADVHGKNHHRDGSFAEHVESLDLIGADGEVREARPGDDVFASTVGGMGLTGIITRAVIRLTPIDTLWMSVDTERAPDIYSVMDTLLAADQRRRYSVAWLDLSHDATGGGVISSGDHSHRDELPRKHQVGTSNGSVANVPGWSPRVVNSVTVAAFNRMWYLRAPRRRQARIESMDSFFFPLDRIGHWNRLYGRGGFLQYQFVVPENEAETLLTIAELLARGSTPVALAVLKRMGRTRGGVLSFPMPGWTLALDLPLGDSSLCVTLDECDRLVAQAGGRVYLAKDSRLRADAMSGMYPELPRWRELKAGLDPEGRIRSNLSSRLRLAA